MIAQITPFAPPTNITDILIALRSLDHLLQNAIAQAKIANGTEPFTDPYRGLYVTQDQAALSLEREPGEPSWQANSSNFLLEMDEVIQNSVTLAQLQKDYQLSNFDMTVILIAIAPEIDLRYERIYAYLQDDVTRKRPTVELALNLLCSDAANKLHYRHRFTADAPLIRHGILQIIADANQIQPPLLAQYLKLDPQITQYLTNTPGLDDRLHPFSQLLIQPTLTLEQLPIPADLQQTLKTLGDRYFPSQSLLIYLQDQAGLGSRVAEAMAQSLNRSLLTVDLRVAHRSNVDLESTLRLLCREARSQNAIVYLPGIDELCNAESSLLNSRCLEILQAYSGITLLAGASLMPPALSAQTVSITLPLPDFAQRQIYWQTRLDERKISLPPEAVRALSDRFRFTPDQIDRTIALTCHNALHRTLRSDLSPDFVISDFFTAARQQTGQELQGLANKLTPHYTWNDIVLSEEALNQLQEICDQVKYRSIVLGQWGFERKLSLGKGTSMLFCGPPGTGKTMAAEVIATDLQLDLYRIDLSQIVSKYIGETEKNLDRIFTAADRANAILFFDEADALFGKRSEVKDSHDRYANLEVGYLLQKMEEYTGISVLATNLRQNMDEAFLRRIQAIVEFPFPDEAARYHLWKVAFPPETPLDPAIDFELLAREVRLAGGNIKNIALAAAFSAASAGEVIGMAHLLKATRQEHQKSGRTWEVRLE